MTRDDRRTKCIEAICRTFAMIYGDEELWKNFEEEGTLILDSLHGVAFVDPIEATEEMLEITAEYTGDPLAAFRRIAAAGDLTNPPEEKP